MTRRQRTQLLSEIAVKPTFRIIDGVSIRFVESDPGNADALLLSPWPESVFAYEPIWSRLAKTTHLVAIDLPGFGRSERKDTLMSPRAMGDFIVRAADGVWPREPAHRRAGHRDVGVAIRRGRTPWSFSQPRRRYRRCRCPASTRRAAAGMGVCARPRTVSTTRWTCDCRARDSDARALCD